MATGEATAREIEHNYIPAVRSFKLQKDSDGNPVLTALVADFVYRGPVARETRPPSEGRDMSPNSGFYAVKDRTAHYATDGDIGARVDLFGEIVEGKHGYRAEGMVIREIWPNNDCAADMKILEKLTDRYRCDVDHEHAEYKKQLAQTRRDYENTLRDKGHNVNVTTWREPSKFHCRLCESEYEIHADPETGEIETDPVGTCTFDPHRSAKAWLKSIGGNPTTWKDCDTLFRVKCGGDPDSHKVGHETYIERRPRGDGKDAYALRYHSTDVVTYLPDGSYILRHGGWLTMSTKKRIKTYSPFDIYNDNLDTVEGTRWIVRRPNVDRRDEDGNYRRVGDLRPHQYFVLDRATRVYPHGGIKKIGDKPYEREGYHPWIRQLY